MDTLGKLIAENPPRHTLRWGYNAAVSALGKARQLEGAKDLVETMKANGKSGRMLCLLIRFRAQKSSMRPSLKEFMDVFDGRVFFAITRMQRQVSCAGCCRSDPAIFLVVNAS